MTDALGPAHLADVDQAFETGFDLDESTERSQVGDLSFDLLADVVVDQNLVPRVGDELLHRQVDALALQVHVKHFDADLIKIGRASCRERVEIAGGTGAGKKKGATERA